MIVCTTLTLPPSKSTSCCRPEYEQRVKPVLDSGRRGQDTARCRGVPAESPTRRAVRAVAFQRFDDPLARFLLLSPHGASG